LSQREPILGRRQSGTPRQSLFTASRPCKGETGSLCTCFLSAFVFRLERGRIDPHISHPLFAVAQRVVVCGGPAPAVSVVLPTHPHAFACISETSSPFRSLPGFAAPFLFSNFGSLSARRSRSCFSRRSVRPLTAFLLLLLFFGSSPRTIAVRSRTRR
ncbi:unnamed protein product, partial [Phaeothamnion confervicola]